VNTILYVGHFEGVPGSTENSYAYAFRKHGWHVEQVEQVEAHRYGPDHVLRAAEACKPQLVLYTRTHNYTALDRRFTDVWRALEAKGIQTASVHLDVFHGIPEREQWIADGDPLFTTGTVFTADGRHTSERAFAEAGVNHVWLPPAIDERNLLPADFQFEPCEGLPPIVWVGSSAYHSEWPWRAELVNFLRREYDDRLIEYGKGSPNGVMRDNATLTTLYSADTIVVGDSMFSDEEEADYGELRYWSDRLPETIGRGGLLMHPIVDREHYAEHYWDNGGSYCHDYVPFRWHHFTPITIGIDQWSQRDMWRSRQATKERGLATVRARHTYTHRAASILQHLGLTEEVSA
jgi:hypothetical protein